MRWPHHSTTPHTWNGTQPCPLSSSGGSVTTRISRPQVGHGCLSRGRPRSSSHVGGFIGTAGYQSRPGPSKVLTLRLPYLGAIARRDELSSKRLLMSRAYTKERSDR
jgi:hypothetical protein